MGRAAAGRAEGVMAEGREAGGTAKGAARAVAWVERAREGMERAVAEGTAKVAGAKVAGAKEAMDKAGAAGAVEDRGMVSRGQSCRCQSRWSWSASRDTSHTCKGRVASDVTGQYMQLAFLQQESVLQGKPAGHIAHPPTHRLTLLLTTKRTKLVMATPHEAGSVEYSWLLARLASCSWISVLKGSGSVPVRALEDRSSEVRAVSSDHCGGRLPESALPDSWMLCSVVAKPRPDASVPCGGVDVGDEVRESARF